MDDLHQKLGNIEGKLEMISEQLKELAPRITTLEAANNTFKGALVGIGTMAAFAGAGISKLLSNIFSAGAP